MPARLSLTPRQHQALLTIRACRSARGHGRKLAEQLRIRHHSAVELVTALSEDSLVRRVPDANDQRRVLLSLTDLADGYLAELSAVHLVALADKPILNRILARIRPTLTEDRRAMMVASPVLQRNHKGQRELHRYKM